MKDLWEIIFYPATTLWAWMEYWIIFPYYPIYANIKDNRMKTFKIAGLLLITGIGFYIFSIYNQISDVAEVCALLTPGSTVEKLKEIESNYSLKLRGPFELNNKPGELHAIFCSELTLCETACSIEIKNDIIISTQAEGT